VGASAVALGIAQGAHELAIEVHEEAQDLGKTFQSTRGCSGMMAEAEVKLNAARAAHLPGRLQRPKHAEHVMLPSIKEASMAKTFTGHAALEVREREPADVRGLRLFGGAPLERDVPGRPHVPDRRGPPRPR